MKPKRKSNGGWKEAPRKPLSREVEKRRRAWLRDWAARLNGLAMAEAERR